jgi:hypothetical protein
MDEQPKRTLPFRTALGTCQVLLISVFLSLPTAKGRDWYPPECCHRQDCAVVESAIHTQPIGPGQLPQLTVTTKHGTAVVPHNFPVRESKDGRMHACLRRADHGMM